MKDRLLRVTAYVDWAQLGGTERVLLDFAERAFEHDIKLSVVSLRAGPLIGILNGLGIEARTGYGIRDTGYETRADVLYAVSPRAQQKLLLNGSPQVWHLHRFPKSWYWKPLARWKPRAVIFNSNHTAATWGFDARTPPESTSPFSPLPTGGRQVVVIPNGVDLDRFKPRPRTGWLHQTLGLPPGARLVGMPTVFQRWKGHAEVMEAFNAVAGEFPDVHLVIVGGPMYATKEETTLDGELRRAGAGRGAGAGPSTPAPASSPAPALVLFSGFVPKIELVYPELDFTVHYSIKPEDIAGWTTLVKGSYWWDRVFLFSNYHLEHHYFPGIPCYHLPRLQKSLLPFYQRHGLPCQTYSSLLYDWFVLNKPPHADWQRNISAISFPLL